MTILKIVRAAPNYQAFSGYATTVLRKTSEQVSDRSVENSSRSAKKPYIIDGLLV
jgi:hypothetical protein